MLTNRDELVGARKAVNRTGNKRNRRGLFERLCRRLGRMPGEQPAGRPTFEGLEARQMLATVPLTAGQFMLYDSTNANPDDVDIIAVGNNTSATVTVTVNSTDGGAGNPDVINSIAITGPGTGANVVVELMLSGPISGPITYTGSGDNVTLRIFQEQVNDAAGGGFGDALTGATSGITAGGAGADQTPVETTNTAADGDSLTADGNLAAITIPETVAGGTIRATIGSTGAITLGAVNLTSNLTIQVDNAGGNANIAGLTVTGNITLGNFNFTATVAKGAGIAGAVSLSNGGTITIGGTGAINVTADATATVAAVTTGDIQLLATAGGTAAANIFSANALAGITGAVTIGDISNAGTNATNDINIGHAGTNVGGDFVVGDVTNVATVAGANVALNANNIAGALTIGSIDTSAAGVTAGNVEISVAGNVTGAVSIAAGGTITMGDAGQADAGVANITFGGTTLGGVTFGDIDLNTTAAGNAVNVQFAGNVGALTIGDIAAQGTGAQAGNAVFAAAGNTGQITVGNVTLGDAGAADVSAVQINVVGTSGGLAVGDITASANAGGNVFVASLGGNTGNIVLGNVTAQGAGSVQSGTIMVVAGGNVGAVSVGNIDMGDQGDAADVSLLLIQVAGTSTSLTVGDVNIANAGNGAMFTFGDDMSGGITVGAVTLQNAGVANAGSLQISVDDGAAGAPFADVGGDINIAVGGAITVGDAGDADAAAFRLTIEGTSGNVTTGDIFSSGNAASVAVSIELGGDTGDLTLGDVTVQGAGTVQSNDVTVQVGGAVGNIVIGNIAMGDAGDADSADFAILGAAPGGDWGSLTTGTITTDGTGGATVSFIPFQTGSIDGISLDDVVLGGTGNDVQIGQIAGANSTGPLGDVTLKNVTLEDSSLTIQGRDIDTVDIAGTWNINGTGSVTLTADAGAGGTRDGVMGDVGQTGANTWDINFAASSSGSVLFNAADGIGAVTINSVDFIAANVPQQPTGGLGFDADSDSDGTGPIGDFAINYAGDDTTGLNLDFTVDAGSQPNVAFNAASYINAADGGNVSIAGGALGTFDASSGPTNAGDWGDFVLGRDLDGFDIPQSDSNGITILADDGVGTITLYGVFSQFTNATVNANVDGDATGSLGDVTISGEAGALSMSDAGAAWLAADFGDILLRYGNFNVSLATNIAAPADRIATTSDLGDVTIVNGAVVGGPNFTIDDGIGNITVTNLTPLNADAVFGNIVSDADGLLGGAAVGGGIASITVGGALVVNTIDTDGVNNLVPRSPSEDSGPITAGETITITTLDVGGNQGTIQAGLSIAIGSVQVNGSILGTSGGGKSQSIWINKPAGATDLVADTITLGSAGLFYVGGDVDSISSGLGLGDDITISAAGNIMGDLDYIDAGLGDVTIANGLRVHAGTSGSPITVVRDNGIDYIYDIAGTWTVGNNAATTDFTLTFLPLDINSILINDLEGTTSDADTIMSIATRANPTEPITIYASSGLGADNTPEFFSLDGFQDDLKTGLYDPPPIPPLQDGQHGFYQIMIEGDLNGPMGADPFPADGWNNSLFGMDTPILGTVRNLEIVGNWANNVANIYVLAIGDISYGSLSVDRMAAVAGDQFSWDSRLSVGGDGVAGPSGNSNGTDEDLEVYTALAPSSDTNVVIIVPDGGSITKSWVGPTGAFEYITFTDTDLDGVVNTVVLNFSSGVIASMYLFGENWGVEYNAVDPENPGTNSSTDIFYGVAYPALGFAATTFTNSGNGSINVIDFLEFSSPIGDVTVVDADTTDDFGANVGNVMVGYVVAIDSASDISGAGLASFIDNFTPVNGLVYTAAGAVVTAGTGALYVEGSLGGVATSGDVGSITTVDTVTEATPVPSADFLGLVTDGSVGAITIEGDVVTSLVVGDRIWTAGPDGLWGTADDRVGINGTPGFLDDITIADDAGTSFGNVVTIIVSDLPPIQLPVITGDQISAPDGIGVNITVGGALRSAIVSGKRIVVDQEEDQSDDDISGNIIASEIFGDIWSGDDIGTGVNGATIIRANGKKDGSSGNISGVYQSDNQIDIIATGASAGDITSDIVATGDMVNFLIKAGSGSGGSILANIVAGRQTAAEEAAGTVGTGAMVTAGGTNAIIADQDIGELGVNVISAADGIELTYLLSGQQTVQDLNASPADPIDGGNINSDVIAGVPVSALGPVESNIVDSTIPIMRNANASIFIGQMGAGTVDGPDQDGNTMNDENSDLNGILTAAGSILIEVMAIDGDVVGNDGVAGRHVIAAGMGWLGSGTPFAAGSSNHAVVEISSAQITDNLAGTISAGMFVPFLNVNNSPINANDLAPLQAGTVLTLGEVFISSMSVGTWDQSATGSNGSNGITLAEMLAGTETGANQAFAPTWSIGATHNITANISVVGRPWVAPQTGPGSISPNPADADGTAISIAAFGGVTGNIRFEDSGDFTFVMSNIDAVTAIDTNESQPGNPSNPSTNLWLNAGQAGAAIGADNTLNITAAGFGTGGLDVDFFTAGFDYFVRLNTGGVPTAADAPAGSTTTTPLQASFWTSFGFGNIDATLRAQDADPTDGLEAGDLSFALIAAGQNISGDFVATDDIIARTDGATTDGSAGFSPVSGLYADFAAGLSANLVLDPTGMASLFPGGNFAARVVAGDDIRRATADELVGLVARAGRDSALGNFTATFRLVSGAEDQIYDSDVSSDISAFVNASGSVITGAQIDAGDTLGVFGGVTNGGLGGMSGRAGGSFYGGVWAGSGTDLDINTPADNIVTADMDGTIRTVDNLDVRGVGIYAENAMDGGVIEVGYGLSGGNLLGSIVAEGRITEIEVFGDVGSAAAPAMIYTGDYVARLLIGNARSIAISGLNSVRASGLTYISSFGTLYGSIFQGGNSNGGAGGVVGGATPILYIGGTVASTSNIAIGSQWGVGGLNIEIGGDHDTYTITGGEGAFFITGGNLGSGIPNAAAPAHGAVDAVLTGAGVSLAVDGTTTGTGAGLRSLLVGDTFGGLTINDGAVGQITVDDDVDVAGQIATFLTGLAINPQQFAFLANSLPTASEIAVMFNNDIAPVGITGAINVDYNIGNDGSDATLPTSIGSGLNVGMTNYAIRTQGAMTGNVTSNLGSIGNIVVGTTIGGITLSAFENLGDLWVELGDVTGVSFIARTGSMGVVSGEDNVTVNITGVRENVGGAIARTGALTANISVHGSVGLLQASGNITATVSTEVGNIGFDLDATDMFGVLIGGAGIYSDLGNISVNFTAGGAVGDISAYRSVSGTIMAGDDVGSVTSRLDGVAMSSITAGGSIGDITAFGAVTGTYTAGDSIGDFTSTVGGVSVTAHARNNIGDITASMNIGGNYVTEVGNIGNITSDAGTISGSFWAVGDIGNVTAIGYQIEDAIFSAENIGNIYAFANIYNTEIEAGGSVGDITAATGQVSSDVVVHANGSIGDIEASGDVNGQYTAETGSIGTVTSVAGSLGGSYQAGAGIGDMYAFLDVEVTAVAGGSIGDITAFTGEISSDTDVLAHQSIGNITASGDIDGSFVAEVGDIGNITSNEGDVTGVFRAGGNIGTVSTPVGAISGDLEAGGNVGSLSAWGVVSASVTAGGNIGDITSAVDAVSGTFHAGGSIGDVTASLDISGAFSAETGPIGDITSRIGDITGTFISAGDIGAIRASTGSILSRSDAGSSEITAGGNIASIYAYRTIAKTVTAGGNIGDITARVGEIASTTSILAHGSIGNIQASEDIAGTFTAEAESIGNITSDVGDILASVTSGANIGNVTAGGSINAALTAVGNIGNITASTGSIMGAITAWEYASNTGDITVTFVPPNVAAGGTAAFTGQDNTDITVGSGVVGPILVQLSGASDILLAPAGVSGLIRAGGNIGNISAFKDIGNYSISAGGRIGTISTQVGDIGAQNDVLIEATPAGLMLYEISEDQSQATDINVSFRTVAGALSIVAGGADQQSVKAMGKISAGSDILGGMAPADVTVNGIRVRVTSPTLFHAVRGSITGIEAVGGSIGDIKAKAGVGIGDIDASENIGGSYIAESGSIGHIISKTGDIGSAADPIYIRANGGVQIDPDTLLFVPRPGTGRDGVGNIYAYLGDIYLDLKSGGDVGVWGSTVKGGIAAPLGTVNGSVVIGGDLGGISGGLGVNLTQNVVLGAVGIYRNLDGGTVRLTSSRPFSVDVGGVTYTVAVENVSNGLAVYRVVGNQLIFDSVTISRDPAVTVNANISITGRFPVADNTPTEGAGDTGATTGNVLVKQLTINGHAGNITVDGSVEKLNVNGNLRDGEVIISGRLGSAFVTRDIGRQGDLSNMTLRVGEGFGSLKAGGTNWGLYTITLNGGEVYSIANANRGIIDSDETRNSDNYVNIYLAKGTAKITVNNGQIDTITLTTRGAEDLAVFTTASPVDTTPDDKKSVWIGRYPKLKASINKRIHFMRETPSTGDTAYVARINTKAPRQEIRGIHIAGSVGDIAFGAGSIVDGVTVTRNAGRVMAGSVVKDVTVWGDIGTISSTTVQSLDLRGNAGRIAGQVVQYATVGGNVDVISGSKLVRSVRVAGNAGSVTSGGILQSLFVNGSAITISGNELKSVQVTGSVGVEVTGGAFGGLSLGAAFSAADVQRILGTADLAQVGDIGPNGGRFLGGIDARAKATNVTVGGLISDLSFRTTGNDMSQLIGQVVDDALIGVAKNAAWQKTDGVLVKFAVQPITGPADAVIRGSAQSSGNGGEEPAQPTPIGTIGQ